MHSLIHKALMSSGLLAVGLSASFQASAQAAAPAGAPVCALFDTQAREGLSLSTRLVEQSKLTSAEESGLDEAHTVSACVVEQDDKGNPMAALTRTTVTPAEVQKLKQRLAQQREKADSAKPPEAGVPERSLIATETSACEGGVQMRTSITACVGLVGQQFLTLTLFETPTSTKPFYPNRVKAHFDRILARAARGEG